MKDNQNKRTSERKTDGQTTRKKYVSFQNVQAFQKGNKNETNTQKLKKENPD